MSFSAIGEWFRRIWYLLNRRRFEEALQRDMEAHRQAMADPRRFGNTLRIREESGDVWGWRWLDDTARDLRVAVRTLSRTPGFALVAIGSLALGLVLTVSTVAVVNAYLIRQMPFPKAERLYHVIYAPQGTREPGGAGRIDWQSLQATIEYADQSTMARFFLRDAMGKREVQGLSVAEGSLEMLGVEVTAGRSLVADDFRPQAEKVALIGTTFWRTYFNSDPQVIGRVFRANPSSLAEAGESFRVVGVLPDGFRWAREYSRGLMEFVVPRPVPMQAYMVRLQEGVPVALAEQRLTEEVKRIATSMPANWQGVKLVSTQDRYTAEMKPMLASVTAAVAFVLIIVCVNVAVLVLLRAIRRQDEVAVRLALGAGRKHVVRLLLAEALLLSGAAMTIGLTLSSVALRLLGPFIEARLGREAPGGTAALSIDSTVLLAAGGLGLSIALLLSLVPLLATWKDWIAGALRGGGRGGTDGRGVRLLRSSLIAVEVGAALALLVGCGLMIQTFLNLVRTDLGIQTSHIVRTRIALPARTYPEDASFLHFYERLNERLSTESTPFALASFIPLYETPQQRIELEPGREATLRAGVMSVSDGYFPMFGIPVLQGRIFVRTDRAGSTPVAIVSDSLARALWPDGGAVGRQIRTAEHPVPGSPLTVWRTVVGVVRDVRQTYVDQDLNDIYLPFLQAPSRYAPLYLKTTQPPSLWGKMLGDAVTGIDPLVLLSGDITGEKTLDLEAARQLAGPRFLMSLLTSFAAVAALLAILGIYGVTAYAAQQREREIAIRIAVGAANSQIVRMFLKDSGIVIAVGIAGGLIGASAVGKLLASQLFGVRPLDVSTYLATAALLGVAGLLASWWPARSAAAKSPVGALNNI